MSDKFGSVPFFYSVREGGASVVRGKRMLKVHAMTKEQEGYIELLTEALRRFYKEDADVLFKAAERSVCECTMVGCISRYVWCKRNSGGFDFLLPDVDVEYNKFSGPESENAKKELVASGECGVKTQNKCEEYDECWKKIDDYKRNKCLRKCRCVDCKKVRPRYKFRPDMIIHRRGAPTGADNGLMVEFKKGEKVGNDQLEAIAFDLAKLRYCTCGSASFKYKIGAFVFLRETQADVFMFVRRKVVEAFSVTGMGRVELDVSKVQCDPLQRILKDITGSRCIEGASYA